MTTWTRTQDGWRLDLGEGGGARPSLPRLELHSGKGAWIVCVLGTESSRACTGALFTLEEAQRAAVLAAQEFLDRSYQPVLGRLLETVGADPMDGVRGTC